MLFDQLDLKKEILKAIEDLGYTEATEIQEKSIPEILSGNDIIGRSSTGTGKTAAFALPIIQICSGEAKKSSVLILSPTRELAVQIADEFRKFTKYMTSISVATVYGGAPMDTQIRNLKSAKIVIGTPGRVMDHLRRKTLKLDNLKTLVLDEADEMLNMGFVDDIRTILETSPSERQTLLFSATMPKAIMDITKEFQNSPIYIEVKTGQKTAENISQSYYNIPQAGKVDALKLLLEFHRPIRSLVFCNTKKMVDELVSELKSSGFKAVGIHGDLKQSQRLSVMDDFKSGRSKILVATDVAARGIDVENIEAVFNYDIPKEYEYYIHRIGRTARAGKKGASFTLVTNRNQLNLLKETEKYIHAQIEEKPVPNLESIALQRMSDFALEIKEHIDDGVDSGWSEFIKSIVDSGYDPLDICAALCEMRQKKNKRLVNVRDVSSPTSRPRSIDGKVWVRISIGSDNKIGPNFIVGALVEDAAISKSSIGKINIYRDHTDVELDKKSAASVLESVGSTVIKGKRVTIKKADKIESKPWSGDQGSRKSSRSYKSDNKGPRKYYK